MRIKLLLSDISAIFLGLLGLYVVLAATLLDRYHSTGYLILLILMGAMAICFLVPRLHNHLVSKTFERHWRIPFVALAAIWLQLIFGLLAKFGEDQLWLPGWNFVTGYWSVIYPVAAALLVFGYVLPGAAYDIMRTDDVPDQDEDLDDPQILGDTPEA